MQERTVGAWPNMEAKWQSKWWEAKLHHAERTVAEPTVVEPGQQKPSYFIHFAYPGISGYLHVGHMRGFTYTDVFARYQKMRGKAVLFPAGFHASGIPAVAFARDVERGEKTEYLRDNGYTGPIEALTTSDGVIDYFADVYTNEYWKKFGFLIDERRNCTTIEPAYQKFIEWQFTRLNDLGYLVTKPHYAPYCPTMGPVAVDKSETDLKQGGQAEIQEFLCLPFQWARPSGEEVILPCATLRPETIFGVTNLWLNPAETYHLVRVWEDGAVADTDPSKLWMVSERAIQKLEWQFERAEATGETLAASDVIGQQVTAPVTGATVPVVSGSFVSPDVATGVVMSVPAHAPFDFAAYRDAGLLESLGAPPVIVTIEGQEAGIPAELACVKHQVASQTDAAALEAATQEIYNDEFTKGVLTDACGAYGGQRVRAVKDRIRQDAQEQGWGRPLREFTEEVISRAGERVEIRRVPNQVFIGYSDPEWTAKAKEHAAHMQVFPSRYQDDLPSVLEWFGDRACVRRGAWLGTRYPFDPEWIIEPIADSTFYSWFYLVTPYLRDGRISLDELTHAFFDYTINGRGAPQSAQWEEVRKDVLFFGPVDINLGGKEHQTVHFPVYVMNNVALLDDPRMRPRGLYVNWWVTQKAGTKISKSKGGAEPIPGAVAKYGVDAMRLYYCHVGSPHADIEWDQELVGSYRDHLDRFVRNVLQWGAVDEMNGELDGWLDARVAQLVNQALDAYEAMDLRTATTTVLYQLPEAIRVANQRGTVGSEAMGHALDALLRLACPLIPHVAEELHEQLRTGGLLDAPADLLLSAGDLPERMEVDEAVLAEHAYVDAVLQDVQTIAKLAGPSQSGRLVIFTTPRWKTQIYHLALDMAGDGKFPMGAFMQAVMADEAMRQRGKDVQKLTGKIPGEAPRLAPWQRRVLQELDEHRVLVRHADRLASALGLDQVDVYQADDDAAPDDPKRALAAPLKPGIVWS